jgi:hypothetical protein
MSATARRRITIEGLILAPLRLLERSRGWRRRGLVLAYLVVLVVVAFPLRWLTALNGLPDVGEPAGLAEFRSRVVPEADNAFTLYREAAQQMPADSASGASMDWWELAKRAKDWATAGEDVRAWQESCRPALAVWRRGTEKEAAQARPPDQIAYARPAPDEVSETLARLPRLQIAALLEGDRLREAGDLAGAWDWYAAAMRASRHLMMNAASDSRSIAEQELMMTAGPIRAWLAVPALDASLLRRALEDTKTARRMTPPNSEALLGDYLATMAAIAGPDSAMSEPTLAEHLRAEHPWLGWLLRVWKREPERSRRVYRILYAHWLAAADLPPGRRPKMFQTQVRGDHSHPDFPYYVAPGRRDAAHPVSSEALYDWYATSFAWRNLLPVTYWMQSHDADRRALDNLVLTIADRLFLAEHGREPTRNEELVQAGYLDALPEGYGDDSPGGEEMGEESGRR